MVTQQFKDRILDDLLPTFCNDPSRGWGCDGFRPDWDRIAEVDAVDFLRGLDAGVIEHTGRGLYRAARSYAVEQFFWSGSRNAHPRPVWLWVEPIITVAVLARFHIDLGWPQSLIGAQSKRWEFDAATYLAPDDENEHIACEVKKSKNELDQLLDVMARYGDPALPAPLKSSKENNAYQKVQGLRARRAPLFWAVGPAGVNYVYRVSYSDQNHVLLEPATTDALKFPSC